MNVHGKCYESLFSILNILYCGDSVICVIKKCGCYNDLRVSIFDEMSQQNPDLFCGTDDQR